uniref:Filament protein n=1 Tax=Philodina roseola TaxID=96448 RepID=B5AHD1_PHIRO|nr:filament protein [Philodina roseola]
MSALKTSLPLFQTTSASSSSSTSSYSNTSATGMSSTTTTSSPYAYRSSPSLYSESRPSINKPPSLFNQTREKEKLELSTLNDKFADYVEKVRYLEAQNKKVQMETNTLNEKQQNHCQRVKSMFENEIAQMKELAEKLFKDKNAIVYAAKDAQNTLPMVRQRLNQTFKESDSSKYETEKVERQLSSIEGDIIMFKRRLAHQDDEHNQWKQLTTHIQRLLLQAKNETHNENLTKNSCEQATKQLRADIAKLREQNQQKLADLKQNTFVFGPNANNDRAHMFKSELSSAIRKIRQEFERENDRQRAELYAKFTQSYESIVRDFPDIAHLFLTDREQERIRQEEERLRLELQRIKNETNTLKQKNGELRLRTRELQINLEMTIEENQRFEKIQQNEIDQLKTKQERVSKDYDEVITKQSSLEKEIETYRNLLEGTMKTVVDTITDEYSTSSSAQSNRPAPRSVSVDRSRSSTYLSNSRLNGTSNNSYSRFINQKTNATNDVIEIPTNVVNGNGLAPSKSAGDLSLKNGIHAVEINGTSTTSSQPAVPPTVLQTRRS